MVLWFTLGVLAITAVFSLVTYLNLYEELHEKKVGLEYPDHPDWRLHGNSSDEEIQDIMNELMEAALVYALPLLAIVIIIGYFLAGKSLKPIKELNLQMAKVTESNLREPIHSSVCDPDFESLRQHLNALLERLAKSIEDIREYAAQVAHELRTPLTILRLKVEQSYRQIDPELQEELQDELHRLTQMVDQSLLLARAGRGALVWNDARLNASALVDELVEDFTLLAAESDRALSGDISSGCIVMADRMHVKQILHGLFANALKHGDGKIGIRLCPRSRVGEVHFLIVNHQVDASDSNLAGLGLGLRVADSLIQLQTRIRFQRHVGKQYYAARLILPMADS